MIIAIVGLPGTGKSTLARALSERLAGAVLDREYLHAHLFPPECIEPSREQEEFCFEIVLQTCAWLLARDPGLALILDGFAFTRGRQATALRDFAAGLGQSATVVECVCPERTAIGRLAANRAARRHLPHRVTDRDAESYYLARQHTEEIPKPKVVADTAHPVAVCVDYLAITIERAARRARSEQPV